MAITRIGGANAISGTIPVSVGGTGVTTAAALANTGNLVKISTATLSSDSLVEFDLDSTYDHYIFRFSKVHGSSDDDDFRFDASLTSDTDYGSATLTYVLNRDSISESSGVEVGANAGSSTGTLGIVQLFKGASADNDHCLDGTFEIFNPASTTFTKGFTSMILGVQYANNVRRERVTGDIRSSTAVDKVKFFFQDGNLDSGTITQYGVKT